MSEPTAIGSGFPWLSDQAEQHALDVACTYPACKAPEGECCRTGGGQPRPAHAMRLEAAKRAAGSHRRAQTRHDFTMNIASTARTCCASNRGQYHTPECGQ